jgi:uncharacterized protein involved in exopolysaccharide biosynthesis
MKQTESPKNIHVLDLLLVLARKKWFIIKVVLISTIIALIVSLVWPTTFKSTVIVMPPAQQRSLSGGLGGIVGSMLPLAFDSENINPEALAVILNSRSIREKLIAEFDLMEVYKHKFIEQALRQLDSNTRIRLIREGGFGFSPITAIELNVIDREPERAQSMANFYITHLDSVVAIINRANIQERLNTIEKRFLQNLTDMEVAENKFRDFQEKHGIIDIESQSRVLVNALADAISQKTGVEIEINILENLVGQNSPELMNLRRMRSELDRVISDLTKRGETESQLSIIPSLEDVPDLGLQYMRLYRDVVVQGKIYETIFPQYVQQQMLAETKKRNIQIIDYAHLPTYKDGPKRAFIVLGGFFFSMFICVFLVLLNNYIAEQRDKESDEFNKINELKELLSFRKK